MAWALRRFPVFPVFGRRAYQVQPIYAEDLASQAVDVGSGRDSFVADAAGPETFSFEELLALLASAVGSRVPLVHTPPSLGFGLTRLVGLLLRDVVLTRNEVDGLVAGLLTSDGVPPGMTRLANFARRWQGSSCMAVCVRTSARFPLVDRRRARGVDAMTRG